MRRERKNLEVRRALDKQGMYLYELAQLLNISEPTMFRRLRIEQPKKTQEKWIDMIKKSGDKNE